MLVQVSEAPSRRGELMDPADRPGKQRQAVRILVRTPTAILLFEDSDPGVPELTWWVTPGGGIDPGETRLQAAVRELAEETGQSVCETALVGPVAHRIAVHGYCDLVLQQEEWFYLLHCAEPFEVRTDGHTEEEQITLQGARWWPLSELVTTPVWTWPTDLVDLLGIADDGGCREYGRVEESTVAVGLGGG